MVKSKKMSKTSIAVIVLALLLVLSLCLGITGAWFTSYDKQHVEDMNFKFGNVTMTFALDTHVSNDADGDNTWFESGEIDNLERGENHEYELIAGSRIVTGITLTNNSTVDAYYILRSKKIYDAANALLVGEGEGKVTQAQKDAAIAKAYFVVEMSQGQPTGKLRIAERAVNGLDRLAGRVYADNNANPAVAAADPVSRSFAKLYKVDEAANGDRTNPADNEGTPRNNIFKVYQGSETTLAGLKNLGNGEAADWGAVNYDANALEYYNYDATNLTYGDPVSLGALLINGEYELRAVQADNMQEVEAYDFLTNDANWAAPAQQNP